MAAPLVFSWRIFCECWRQINSPVRRIVFQHERTYSTSIRVNGTTQSNKHRDPFPLFIDTAVQNILRRITGFNVTMACVQKRSPVKRTEYKLLSDEQLGKELQHADEIATRRLQMPPIMNVREPITDVLSSDPELEGLDTAKYIFTDISSRVTDLERNIVTRDPDGTLRKASWDERDRMNQVFFPQEGRTSIVPKLFQEKYLEKLLTKGKYIYILNRSCVQFEPSDPEYIRVTHRTYECINEKRHYDVLRSTRHFGAMAFYLTWFNNIDHLLADMMQRDLLSDAGDLVRLYDLIHEDSESAKININITDDLQLVKNFFESSARRAPQLELSIQVFEDSLQSRAKEGVI